MPILGSDTEPTFSYHAYSGTTTVNQEAEILTAPTRIRVTDVGLWIGGWSGTCRVKACVWDDAGVLLAESAETVIANEGAAGTGNIANYEIPLLTEALIENGAQFLVGFNRHRDDAHQVSTGFATADGHRHGRGFYSPAADFGALEAFANQSRRIGCYVADYRPAASIWVYRSGAWAQAETVQVYRSGAWTDADAVQAYRSGVWEDAE